MSEISQLDSHWHTEAIEKLTNYLSQDDDILSIALVGSGANRPEKRDLWSDIDALIVLHENALKRYFRSLDWLENFGSIFAYEHHDNGNTKTLRVCFSDYRRFDIVLTTDRNLQSIEVWSNHVFWKNRVPLFSREATIENALDSTGACFEPAVMSEEQFETFVNGFWFKLVIIINKLARNDRLIASHLTLDLIRDCLVMGMILRDRDKSYPPEIFEKLQSIQNDFSVDGILDSLEQSTKIFDWLALKFSEKYQSRHPIFTQWLANGYVVKNQ